MQEEDLYTVFANDNPELGVEAIRVPRDPKTSIGKGFGFVLFKTKVIIRKSFWKSCFCIVSTWKKRRGSFLQSWELLSFIVPKFLLYWCTRLFGSKFSSQGEDSVCIS